MTDVRQTTATLVAAMEPTRRRGGENRPRLAVTGRNRLELVRGTWRTGDNAATVTAGSSALDGVQVGLGVGWLFGKAY